MDIVSAIGIEKRTPDGFKFGYGFSLKRKDCSRVWIFSFVSGFGFLLGSVFSWNQNLTVSGLDLGFSFNNWVQARVFKNWPESDPLTSLVPHI